MLRMLTANDIIFGEAPSFDLEILEVLKANILRILRNISTPSSGAPAAYYVK